MESYKECPYRLSRRWLLDDAKNRNLCWMELSNPEFVDLVTQELKLMLNDTLEKAKN